MTILILLGVITLVWTLVVLPAMRMLAEIWDLQARNFRGKKVPEGFGFVLVLAVIPIYGLMAWMIHSRAHTAVFGMAILGFGILGIIDDIYGDRSVGGFRGHFGLLLKGEITTGLIKAVGGGILALLMGIAIAKFKAGPGICNGLLICLTANVINLLDLRPGRAVSCFWIGAVLVILSALATSRKVIIWPELIPVFTTTAVLTWLDRSEKVMLGDAGSYALGAVLGAIMAYELGFSARIVVVIFLVLVNIYAEVRSISKLIEGNRVLARIDRLFGVR